MTMLTDMMNDMIHGGKPLEDPAVKAMNEVLNDNDEFDVIVSDDQEPISEYGNSRQLQDLVPRGTGELMVNEESMKKKVPLLTTPRLVQPQWPPNENWTYKEVPWINQTGIPNCSAKVPSNLEGNFQDPLEQAIKKFKVKEGVKVQCSEIVASTETNVTKSCKEYRAQENEKGNQSKRDFMNVIQDWPIGLKINWEDATMKTSQTPISDFLRTDETLGSLENMTNTTPITAAICVQNQDKAIVTNKNCFEPNFQLINEKMRSDHKTAKKKVEVGTSEESSKRAQIREMIKKWGATEDNDPDPITHPTLEE
ncbi:hypothetical protein F3Y22_tig00111582pilonHSYRG00813 [Hibiscus syriacus]|uniref:Uncharacterized protein n=1 Tax=Hibiscus syriacus TaxID=106335 RepID=A0A6A2YJQ0_HIBSY|nr:hypothetical protein F3Y22_tig00111582pilonHSYRG00813 [Hibiscus syriacus]